MRWAGRIAAVALPAMAVLVLATLVGRPIVAGYAHLGNEIENARELLGQLEGRVRLDSALSASALAPSRQPHDVFLEGGSEPLAAAALQGTLKRMAQDAGIDLASARGEPVRMRAGVAMVAVRIDVAGDYDRLANLLQRIEAHRPWLAVPSLVIEAEAARRPEGALRLKANIEIAGAWRPGPKP